MPMTLQHSKHEVPAEPDSRADDLVKRIRKLRWMGMEQEAEELRETD